MCWAHTSFTQKIIMRHVKSTLWVIFLLGDLRYRLWSCTEKYISTATVLKYISCFTVQYVTIRSNSHLCIDVSVHLREEKHCLPPNNCAAAGRSRNIGRRVKVSVILWPTPQRVTTQNIIAPLFHILGIKWLNGKSWDKMSGTILMLSL